MGTRRQGHAAKEVPMTSQSKSIRGLFARARRALRWPAWTFAIEVTEDDIAADLTFRNGAIA